MLALKGKVVLVVGATSSIARALAVRFAAQGARLCLVARDGGEAKRVAQDLTVRYGVEALSDSFEAQSYDLHDKLVNGVLERFERIDIAVLASGELGDQSLAQSDFQHACRIINANYTGSVSILTHIAAVMERQGSGLIIGISSVAGDRGRASNYLYGSAKGAFSLFLQGLRARLYRFGVRVVTVKPGFVDTKMTFGKPGLFLVASPDGVAAEIIKAMNKGADIVYVPWFWRWIMLIIGAIPEPLFKRLKL